MISTHPITLQYIHGDHNVVKEADMVTAFTLFIPNGEVCMGQSGWSVEFAKLLKKTFYVLIWKRTFGSGTIMMRIYFTRANR